MVSELGKGFNLWDVMDSSAVSDLMFQSTMCFTWVLLVLWGIVRMKWLQWLQFCSNFYVFETGSYSTEFEDSVITDYIHSTCR